MSGKLALSLSKDFHTCRYKWRRKKTDLRLFGQPQLKKDLDISMLDLKTGLLIFGFVFLMLLVVRSVTRKQKERSSGQVKSTLAPASEVKPRMTAEQFNKSWKSLSYLLLVAAAGNLYMLYNSVIGALETGSYFLWADSLFSLAAAVIAVLIWRLHLRILVILYMVVVVIPIMFFISTGHGLDGLIHLFPLVLVYFVVKPVWEFME